MKHNNELFIAMLNEVNLPIPYAEHKFCTKRKWRFDYYWEEWKLALEVEGGVWINGGHTRGSGFVKNMEKYNTAATMGIRLIRCLPKEVCTWSTILCIDQALIPNEGYNLYINNEDINAKIYRCSNPQPEQTHKKTRRSKTI